MSRPDLKRGDQGDDVRFLQERLVAHLQNDGIRLSAVDGDFGPITEASVEHFQQLHGLSADGIVGEQTWQLLEADPAGGSSSSPSSSSTPGAPTTLRMRPIDTTVPFRLQLHWDETTINDINLQLSSFDLRSHPGAQLSFLQPVGRLFGNGGVEALNLELRTWPNWFATWSVQAVVDWDQNHGLVIGANNHAQIGIRPLRGVDITATGNLNLRFTPSTGTGTAEPSGSIMLNIDILHLLGQ
jgi:peptidoglycan hydrolase-like protein with peptidoglycan-binding domain